MRTTLMIRFLLAPLGLFVRSWELAKEGSRDILNRLRFKDASIASRCCIDEDSIISSNTHLLSNCIVNNSQISSYSYIGNNCIIQNTTIGKFCSIANDVLIGLGNHPIDYFSTSPLFYRVNNPLKIQLVDSNTNFQEYKPIQIGNDVWIGARAIVLDGVTIGHGAIIAANSVVTRDVPPYAILGGIPAKLIKYRFTNEKIEQLLLSQWWNWDITIIKQRIDELNE